MGEMDFKDSLEYALVFIYGLQRPLSESSSTPLFNDYQLKVVLGMIEAYANPVATEAEKDIISMTNERLSAEGSPTIEVPEDVPPMRLSDYHFYTLEAHRLVNAGVLPEWADYNEVVPQLYANDVRFHRGIEEKIKSRTALNHQEFSRLCSAVRTHIEGMSYIRPVTPNEQGIITELANCGKKAYGIDAFDEQQMAEWVDAKRYKIRMDWEQLHGKPRDDAGSIPGVNGE